MRTRLAIPAALCACLAGCSRPRLLAEGPVRLGDGPADVPLAAPVQWTGQDWELCFEFERPGDSHHADAIATVLVSSPRQRASTRVVETDRRGESTVCHVVRPVTPVEGTGAHVRALELRAGTPLEIRAIRGGIRQIRAGSAR